MVVRRRESILEDPLQLVRPEPDLRGTDTVAKLSLFTLTTTSTASRWQRVALTPATRSSTSPHAEERTLSQRHADRLFDELGRTHERALEDLREVPQIERVVALGRRREQARHDLRRTTASSQSSS